MTARIDRLMCADLHIFELDDPLRYLVCEELILFCVGVSATVSVMDVGIRRQ